MVEGRPAETPVLQEVHENAGQTRMSLERMTEQENNNGVQNTGDDEVKKTFIRGIRLVAKPQVPNSRMSEWSRPQNKACSSGKKFSIPTISIKLFALIRSRLIRGKPSGSTFLADRNDDTGVILRVVAESPAKEESL